MRICWLRCLSLLFAYLRVLSSCCRTRKRQSAAGISDSLTLAKRTADRAMQAMLIPLVSTTIAAQNSLREPSPVVREQSLPTMWSFLPPLGGTRRVTP